MLHFKQTLLILLLALLSVHYSFTLWDNSQWIWTETSVWNNGKIEWIDFLDNKTLSFKVSLPVISISKDSQVKILDELNISNTVNDSDNLKKVLLTLDNDLADGINYSIISITDWLDTNIDFTLSWDTSKILNKDMNKNETSIEYITVVDNKNIEIYFNNDLTITKLQLKMFKELKSESIFLDASNLNVKMIDALAPEKEYITILELKDTNNKEIDIENSFYDFKTPTFENQALPIVPPPIEDIKSTTPIENNQDIWQPPIEESMNAAEETPMKAAEETNMKVTEETPMKVTEETAMKVKETPNTWTKINLLLLITFLFTWWLFFFTKKWIIKKI